MKKYLLLFALAFIACKKKDKSCAVTSVNENSNHKVSLESLATYPSLLDTLAKYPQLQVYKVINDEYQVGVHCNVYHQGLPVLSDHYNAFQSKSTNEIHSIHTELGQEINIALQATITKEAANTIAKNTIEFNDNCLKSRLGIFNINSSKGDLPKDYRLVYKIQNENETQYVIVDAHTGVVYRQNDGIY